MHSIPLSKNILAEFHFRDIHANLYVHFLLGRQRAEFAVHFLNDRAHEDRIR